MFNSPLRRVMCLTTSVCMILVALEPARGQGAASLSRRNANYTIRVQLDPKEKSIEGTEVLSWRNDTEVPANELWFHLYYNAWKNNKTTWLRESVLRTSRPIGKKQRGDWASCQVTSVRILSSGPFEESDLTGTLRVAAPDDGNPDDETVMVAPLPQPVQPGETIQVEIAWTSKIPRTFARTGFRGNFFFLGQWFPKVGVYQADGTWNCHQFHAATEFFSDYGVYDVQITVPAGWKVGATGVELGVTENKNGTATHRFLQEDVHDFAWTTSPDFREAHRRFEYPGLKAVDMRLLYQPEHEDQVARHFSATEAALQYYGTWFGEYPYGHITIIDPAWRSGASGMEYPTLFTCGTRYLNPEGGGSPESVTIHECGHQFWYGIVGNNEFEDAWLDEGFNTFSQVRVMDVALGEIHFVRRFFRGFLPVMVDDIVGHRLRSTTPVVDRYRRVARSDIEATPTYLYFPDTAAGITYNKTAVWLHTLERMLGWETLQKIMATYFQRWKFRHPKPADFFAIANEVSGKDLTPFFDQVYRKPAVFDFSIESVTSQEVRTKGLVQHDGEIIYSDGETGGTHAVYETQVVVRRRQDGSLPVEVLLVFENGEEFRDVWDARGLWKLYRMVKPAKLKYAVVDPDRKIVLDINFSNNSRLLKSQAGLPATKWASKWLVWLQDYLLTLSFLF